MAKEEIEHKKKRYLLIILMALLVAFLAVIMAQNAQDTADINNVFEVVVNNTNLAPTFVGEPPGTGERVTGTTYFANDSPIQLMVFAHASAAGGTATVEVWINNTMVQNQSGRPLAAPEQTFRSVAVIVPKFSSYSVNLSNYHHYEWREYQILSGKNGTLSVNQTFITSGSSFNATYDAYGSSKVNKSGDTMTGNLNTTGINLLSGNLTNAAYLYPQHIHINENGSTSPIDPDVAASVFTLDIAAQNKSPVFNMKSFNNSSLQFPFFSGGKARGNMTHPLNVSLNDLLFSFTAVGYKITGWSLRAAAIDFFAEGHFNDTSTPTAILFATVKNGTTTLTYRWGIDNNGTFYPNTDNTYAIGKSSRRVKNLSIVLTPIGATKDAVCYDGTEISTNTGLSTCTVSKLSAKNNITNASYDPLSLQRFQLITYDYVVKYPHVIEAEDRMEYTEKTVKRYGLIAEQVEAIDPLLVGHDEFGNPTGIHYEDLAAYLMNVTQDQQNKIDNICLNMPSLCQQNPGILAKAYDSLKFVLA